MKQTFLFSINVLENILALLFPKTPKNNFENLPSKTAKILKWIN